MSIRPRPRSAPTARLRRTGAVGVLAALLAASTVPLVIAPSYAGQSVVVSPHPDQTHPRILNGRTYAIATYGNLVAVGGSFTSVRNGAPGSPDQTRQWIFLYDSSTGKIVETFNPVITGPTPDTSGLIGDKPGVEAIEFAPDGQSLYVAGWFTSVNGQAKGRIAQLNLDGSTRASFTGSVNGVVKDLALTGGRLIAGGKFGFVNGQPVSRLVALDPTTGATQTDFNLPALDSRDSYAPYVQELDAAPDGRWLAVAGNFSTIGTVARNQVALIDLQGTPKVANWSTDDYSGDCAAVYDDSWVRGIDISPDSSYMVVSGTGAYRGADSLCDSAARWELPPTQSGDNLHPTWRTLTGGDTFWANHITDAAVYVGGHERWVNNPRPTPGGDNDGPGAVARAGIVALDPLTGVPLSWNPGRDRGRGAEAIASNDDFLFVGSDTDLFDGQVRQRLAPLPVVGGTANPQPVDVELPVTLSFAVGSSLRSASFDGATLGPVSTAPGSSDIDWSGLRDGFVQDGRLHYFGADQAFYSRPFSDSAIGAATNLSTSVGYVDHDYDTTPYDQPYGVAETTVAAYRDGQIYYVKSGDGKLYHRGYSLESGIIDSGEVVASGRSFANARAIEFVGDWLYAAWSNGNLYRFPAPGGRVDLDANQVVDTGSTVDWSQVHGLMATPATGTAVQPTAPSTTCSGSTPWRAEYWSNTSLGGGPDNQRCEADVNYNFGAGGPAGTNVGVDRFSARWTRTVTLADPGALRVAATADDGVRVYVDGTRIIDSWVDNNGTTRTGTSAALAAGDHEVRVEYYENAGDALAKAVISTVAAPAPPVQPDNLPGETAVTTPTSNQTFTTSAARATGTATDNRGVTTVRVGVVNRNESVNRWLQADGTWGPTYAWRPATITPAGDGSTTSVTWSLGVTLPSGSYGFDAVAMDAAGNADPTSAYRQFAVNTTPVDTTAPTSTVTAPAPKSTVPTSFTATGSSTDDTAVDVVRVGVFDRTASTWLQPDGSWAASYSFRQATLASRGASTTGWSLPLTLPQGSYALDVRGRDAAGNVAKTSVWNPFTVKVGSSDTTPPSTVVTAPAKNAVVAPPTVRFAGTTTDDTSVGQVRLAIYNRVDSTNRWLQANGTWGPTYAYRTATLASPGAASTTWSLSVTLPSGLYGLDAKAVDGAGNLDPTSPYTPFQVGTDSTTPTASLTSSAKATKPPTVTLSGTARDNSSVQLVRVAVRKLDAPARKRWLQKNGGWGRKKVFVVSRLSDQGARSTRYWMRLKAPSGTYLAAVVPVDASRNSPSRATTKRFTV